MYFISFILKNLTRRPVRTGLTVLGLAVAVGSMIALLGISNNFVRSVMQGFERRGIDLVVVPGGQADQLSGKIDESALDQVRAIPGVKQIGEAVIDVTEMWKRDKQPGEDSPPSMSVMIQAWPPNTFAYDDLVILGGRKLTTGDTNKVMIGSTLADNLNKKIGDSVTILAKPYEIVGLFKSFNVFETGAIIMDLKEYQKETGLEGKVTGFSVRVHKSAEHPEADVEEVRQQIMALTDAKGRPVRLAADPPQKYVENASHLKITRAMAWMVSIIALVIGVISMLNTMVMSVLERTQEIGILRAVGWPRSRIIKMVLGEAMMLGLIAAAVGAVGAVGVTYALSYAPKVNGFIEGGIAPNVILEGIALTVLIGIIGGAYPAFRAARLQPTEAIRHD